MRAYKYGVFGLLIRSSNKKTQATKTAIPNSPPDLRQAQKGSAGPLGDKVPRETKYPKGTAFLLVFNTLIAQKMNLNGWFEPFDMEYLQLNIVP